MHIRYISTDRNTTHIGKHISLISKKHTTRQTCVLGKGRYWFVGDIVYMGEGIVGVMQRVFQTIYVDERKWVKSNIKRNRHFVDQIDYMTYIDLVLPLYLRPSVSNNYRQCYYYMKALVLCSLPVLVAQR